MLNVPDLVVAYIGPGAGLGGLAVAIAILLGALFLMVGLVWYPLKRMLGKRAGATSSRPADDPE